MKRIEEYLKENKLTLVSVSRVRFEYLPKTIYVTNYRIEFCPICSKPLNRNFTNALKISEDECVKINGCFCKNCDAFFGTDYSLLHYLANNSFNDDITFNKKYYLDNYAQYSRILKESQSLLYQFYLSGERGMEVFSVVTDLNEVDESKSIIPYDTRRARVLLRAFYQKTSNVRINRQPYMIQKIKKPSNWESRREIYQDACKHVKEREMMDFEAPDIDASQIVSIYNGATPCERKHHIYDYRGILTVDNESIELYCEYCYECQKYFIKYKNYEKLLSKYGFFPLKLNVLFEDFSNGFFNRRDKSPLRLYGYCVNEEQGLSRQQRQKILAHLIDMKIMTKYEISNHLQMLIETNGKQYKNRYAVKKWREDNEFVNNYRSREHPKVEIKALVKG